MFAVSHIGLEALKQALENIESITDDVQKDMLNAQADVVVDAQVYTAGTMLQGPYYKGGVARSVFKSKPRKKKSGLYIDIGFRGTQHGNRLAEIAFVNEYGKKGQPARAFIKHANEISAEASATAGYDVYDRWLNKNGL